MPNLPQTIGQLVKSYRSKLGMTQLILAEKAAYSPETIRKVEKGTYRSGVNAQMGERLAEALCLEGDERANFLAVAAASGQQAHNPAPSDVAFEVIVNAEATPKHNSRHAGDPMPIDGVEQDILDYVANPPRLPRALAASGSSLAKRSGPITWILAGAFLAVVGLAPAGRVLGGAQIASTPLLSSNALGPTAQGHAITATIVSDNYDAAEDVWRGFRIQGDELHHDWVGSDERTKSGWIFASLPIPARATIVGAFVRFRGYGYGHGTATVFSTNEISAEPFDAAGSNRITARKRSNQRVLWIGSWANRFEWYETPNLAPLFQEAVNRSGWRAGNNVAIFLEGALSNGANFCIVDFSQGPLDVYRTVAGHATTLFLEYIDP